MGRTSKKSTWTKVPIKIKKINSNGKEEIRSVGIVKWKQEKMKPIVVKVGVTEPDREPIVVNVRVVESNYDEKSLSKVDE